MRAVWPQGLEYECRVCQRACEDADVEQRITREDADKLILPQLVILGSNLRIGQLHTFGQRSHIDQL